MIQVAEVAVKNEFKKGVNLPEAEETGNDNRIAPVKISRKKPSAIICVGRIATASLFSINNFLDTA